MSLTRQPTSTSISRKPVLPVPVPGREPSLHRTLARSHSTLWRPWSPGVASLSEYERSLYKYPWLSGGGAEQAGYQDLEGTGGYSSVPQPTTCSYPNDNTMLLPASVPEEAGQPMMQESKAGHENVGLQDDTSDDPDLVTWDGPNDPANPKNWPKYRRWTATVLVSCFTFISPVASTMLAPALPTLQAQFQIEKDIETYLLMSIFLLAYAVGPFVLAPLSEMYGRIVVLQSANMVFLLFNTVCGFSASKEQMLAFRFLSGLGGSAPQALGGGVLSDCWRAEERGMATAIYSLAPFLGPAIGPIAAGYLTQYLDWRWIFWTVSIADALVQVLAFLFLPETYAPKILYLKARKLRKVTGNKMLHTEYERPDRTFGQTLRKNLVRPFIMLGTQPVLQVTAGYRAYLYGLMYLVLASFPTVWMDIYHQEPGPASLNYISLGVGFVTGLQVAGPVIDKVYTTLQAKHNHPGRPEFRIPLMFPTAVIAPAGLLLYGLSAHFKTHWIVPNIGAAIFAGGLILSFQCIQTYTIDTYERYAASATGAAAFVRTMAGFGFPLFAPQLYRTLGVAAGNGLLAGIACVLGLVIPTVMWKYGAWLRSQSPYCSG
ncbi:MFS general substrate transporter [Sodiomyces alkalinus F11]|uniref:MFS general substrate transporter n=1 Tax=Sodiomyces alkalinus (strain CBS 110278 / VKM F-3762 / F11) TaxID=1314773 RepID=A0A3N2PNW0_SODAK|nr:MFS general substrate transporter [Sodiomyces alkalinus F11]ROT36120.1 MFS general substrate transporter [Sodiomyces alkalinus F11]